MKLSNEAKLRIYRNTLEIEYRAAAVNLNKMGDAPQHAPLKVSHMTSTQPLPIGQPQLSFISEGQVKFTSAQANLVIKWCRYERQRDEKRAKGHIATLAEEMRRGNWLPKSQIDFAKVGGTLTLVNGHHRMRAQIEADCDILWNVVIHDCETEQEVRNLYYRFDTNVRIRTSSNILSGIGFADEVNLAKQHADALWRAVQIISDGMSVRQHANSLSKPKLLTDDRIAFCHEFVEQAKMMQVYTAKAPVHLRRKLRSQTIYSLALVTLQAEPETACDFWKGLCEDDGLRKGDPRKTLLADMQTRSGKTGLIIAPLMAAAKAWNAFRDGRDLKIIKVTGHPVPIDGTQYTVS